MLWDKQCRDHDQLCGKLPDIFGCIIKVRKERRRKKHDHCHGGTEKNGKDNDLCVGLFGAFHISRAEDLSDNDGNGFPHGDKGNVKQVAYRIGDVEGSNHVEALQGIACRKGGHTGGPERFVQ